MIRHLGKLSSLHNISSKIRPRRSSQHINYTALTARRISTRNTTTWQQRLKTVKPRLKSPGGHHDIFSEPIASSLLTRIPAFVLLLFLMNHEEYSPIPFTFDFMAGPSMLPTIHPTGECYLRVKWWFLSLMGKTWDTGDIIVFKDTQGKHACKRIVGLGGHHIDRMGEYAHFYQDEDDCGIRYVPFDFGDWISQLDKATTNDNDNGNGKEMVVIPNGRIWVEGDNPLHSVDSRHYGTISTDSILGIVSYRIWPRRRKMASQNGTEKTNDSCITNALNRRPLPLTDDEMFSGPYNIVKIPYTK